MADKNFNPVSYTHLDVYKRQSVMRTTALGSVLEVLSRNYSFRASQICMYEAATVYIKDRDVNKLPSEPKILTIGMYGQNIDFYELKGIAEELLDGLNISGYDFIPPEKVNPTYHPGRSTEIVKDGKILGIIGQIHPTVQKNFDISVPVFAAELPIDAMYDARNDLKEYKSIPKFPSVLRDLALVCSQEVYSAEIEGKIKKLAGKYLENISVFDVYSGSQVPEGYKSIAYSLSLRADHTLTDEETDKIMQKILEGLKKDGIELRQ